jgi:hypothetical protein
MNAHDFWIYYQIIVVCGTWTFALSGVYIAYQVKKTIIPLLKEAVRYLQVLRTAKLIEERRRANAVLRTENLPEVPISGKPPNTQEH